MNNIKNTIGWADYSWNPIMGCKKGCSYCYAKSMNDRFKFIPDFSKPQFFPERLNEPSKLKKTSKIFVCSMGEIFDGEWGDICKIIEVAFQNPQHTFMFLTQKPEHYKKYIFPDNAWLGITLKHPDERYYNEFLANTTCNKRFVSIEPIRDSFHFFSLKSVDLVIIGAMTGKNAKPTQREWIESVKHHNIFYKDNLKGVI